MSMSRHLLVAFAVVVLGFVPAVAAAQEVRVAEADSVIRMDFNSTLVNTAVPPVLLGAAQLPSLQRPVTFERRSNRPSALMLSLYASTAAMQALDVHSTLNAFKHGAVEANPMMTGVAKNKAAFIALKAGMAASTILASRNMAKRNKVAAIATMVAINSAYAFVISHNYKVARNQR
jgi:hypothetical protein